MTHQSELNQIFNDALSDYLEFERDIPSLMAIINALDDAKADARDILQRRESANEAAYEAQQSSLMASGGTDDSAYRKNMQEAGRGHLLR